MTAATRKSIGELARRKARTIFTVLTLALAVASVGIFAIPALMADAMEDEVAANRLSDVTVTMSPLELTAADLEALAALPNVADVEPRVMFITRVWVGERRVRAVVEGVRDYSRQVADLVNIASGAAPGAGEALTDRNNAGRRSLDLDEGDTVRLLTVGGGERALRISGVGRNMATGENDPSNDWITFYTTAETAAALSGRAGYTSIGLRLHDNSRPAAGRAIAAVRDELRARTGFTAFDDLPLIQDPGGYPGKESFEGLVSLFNVITLLALLSALVLVSSTMTTLVGEQTGEIAAMKAIGARRRDIRRIYLGTAVVLGALGAAIGVVLGIVLANVLVRYFGSLFFGMDIGVGVSIPVVAASVALGLVGPPLAALPAVRRAARLPLNEALNASGSAVGGQGRIDGLLRRVPGPRSVQIGLRTLGRRRRRSIATVAQVALAVATFLALLAVGTGVGQTTREWFDDQHYDVWVHSMSGRQFGPGAVAVIEKTTGVDEVQSWLQNEVRVGDRDAEAWGLPAGPFMNTRVRSGRFHGEHEVVAGARVVVLGPALARSTGAAIGDSVDVTTAGGPVTLRVIGISDSQIANGDAIFLPVTTLQSALGAPAAINSHWIRTASADEGDIDRTTTRVEDALTAAGEQVSTLVVYDMREQQVAANAQITTAITVLGMLIVALSMVALINTVTMSVIERTRDVGMLRSIGARAGAVRGIFAAEGIAVAVEGWLLGIPLGYLLARILVWAVEEAVGISVTFVFPLVNIAVALVGTVVLAVLVMLAPLRRAVRLKPGEALRTR